MVFFFLVAVAYTVDTNEQPELSNKLLGKSADAPRWSDCSEEENIENPTLVFQSITAVPPVFIRGTKNWVVHKTVTYSGDEPLKSVVADFTQYYRWSEYFPWLRWLTLSKMDACAKHLDCPAHPNSTIHLSRPHAHINTYTPPGWYRSRQVYMHGISHEKIGCVDMQFEYRHEDAQYITS